MECRVVEADRWCRKCGCEGVARDTVTRRLAHEPFGHRPTTLLIRVRRYKCSGCGHVWRQDTIEGSAGAGEDLPRRIALGVGGPRPRSPLRLPCRGGAGRVVVRRELGDPRGGQAAPDRRCATVRRGHHDRRRRARLAAHAKGRQVRDRDHRPHPRARKAGPARLLDMVEGRSKAVFKQWLTERPSGWREGIEVVAMDGFTGFKTAAAEEVPDAVPVMDPFHVIRLAGDALESCRRRVQHAVFGRRGMKSDPLYQARRTLLTGAGLLTEPQQTRLEALSPPKPPRGPSDMGCLPGHDHGLPGEGPRLGPVLPAAHDRPDRRRRSRRTHRDPQARPHTETTRGRRARLLRPTWHEQRPDRSDQRPS